MSANEVKETESVVVQEIEIPLGLRAAIESGECVLFIGAGLGKHVVDSSGKPAPDGKALAEELAKKYNIDTEGEFDLAKVSQIVELHKGRADLEEFMRKRLAGLTPDDSFKWLFQQRWKAIYTTNYDSVIQRAYELITPQQNPISFTNTSELVPIDNRFQVPIYHIHGSLFGSAKPQIVVTESDYSKFRAKRKMLFELLKKDFATSTILYVGYSNRDWNWKLVLTEMEADFYPSTLPKSYRLSPKTNSMDVEILRSKGIETIDCSLEDFVVAGSRELQGVADISGQLSQIKKGVPEELLPAFEKSPAAIARFLSSWSYVNIARFNEKSNIHEFLRGDRPNWALVGAKDHFERDIEPEVYNGVLDYLTGNPTAPTIKIVLGPAGYGVSTLLMSIAAKLVNEKVKPVFMLKPGLALLEGDIEFASSLFANDPVFVIDNASDYSIQINNSIHKIRETSRKAVFLLGARLNEWRQSPFPVSVKEYIIDPLSDQEIDRLLACLERHGELNHLENLTPEMRFSVIKQKHKQELLVTLREATEDKSFDAILEDEFRGIDDSDVRKLYLYVCCFYQNGAYLRDMLLPELVGIAQSEIYDKLKKYAEGVLLFDCLDEINQIYGVRARHRTIASVVWERCSVSAERGGILHKSLSLLNLNHKADKDAFEQFIRSDRLVDSIGSLEAKTKFFEEACRKEPLSAYVRQHYARMLTRERKAELALSQIDEALKLNQTIRVLYHTKGCVLAQLAIEIESPDIARRRFAQSEENFRKGIGLYSKDEYCYQGLAQLYLDWSKYKAASSEEAAEFISRAEEIINEGLKVVRVRDGLWIASSYVQQLLGDEPARLKALEKAVEENPGGIISRYLLGRAYRKAGDYDRAIKILDHIIKNHHDEFRPFVEYALAVLYKEKGESAGYKNALAILQLSTLYGLSDPRYIATLGGMYVMDGQQGKATETFEQAYRHNLSTRELNEIQFYPPDPANISQKLRIKGKVVVVKPYYSLIESTRFPRFLCPHSKIGRLVMKEGMEVTYELGFAARGSVADNPQEAS